MPHHHELTMPDETAPQPQIKIAWLIGTLAAFAIFAAIAGYSARMTNIFSDYDQDRATQRYETLKKVRQAENALLYPAVDASGRSHAEWADHAKGVVRIPIEQAMAEAVDALKSKQPAAAAEIPGAAPAPAAAPAPIAATTNAAPAPAPVKKAPAPTPKPAKPKEEKK